MSPLPPPREFWSETFDEEIRPRIEFLRRNDKEIEAFLLISATIEVVLCELLKKTTQVSFAKEVKNRKSRLEKLLKKYGSRYGGPKLERQTLGALVRIFRAYYRLPKTDTLKAKLKKIIVLRNKLIHKLYDQETINELDRELGENFSNAEITVLDLFKLLLKEDLRMVTTMKRISAKGRKNRKKLKERPTT